jgi:hypothetical protein
MSLEEMVAELDKKVASIVGSMTAATTAEVDPWTETYLAEFAGLPRSSTQALSPGEWMHETDPEKFVTERYEYIPSATGKLLYSNGVIADPETGEWTPPPGKAVPGTKAWWLGLQEKWSEKEANQWRKKLIALGFDQMVEGGISESGGLALDLYEGLRAYHGVRYTNYGQVPKPRGDRLTRRDLRKSLDMVALKEDMKTMGSEFELELSDSEADQLADRLLFHASRLAKNKDWDAEGIISGATTRVKKEFGELPGVQQVQELIEEDEMNTEIEDSIVSISQLAAIQ